MDLLRIDKLESEDNPANGSTMFMVPKCNVKWCRLAVMKEFNKCCVQPPIVLPALRTQLKVIPCHIQYFASFDCKSGIIEIQ